MSVPGFGVLIMARLSAVRTFLLSISWWMRNLNMSSLSPVLFIYVVYVVTCLIWFACQHVCIRSVEQAVVSFFKYSSFSSAWCFLAFSLPVCGFLWILFVLTYFGRLTSLHMSSIGVSCLVMSSSILMRYGVPLETESRNLCVCVCVCVSGCMWEGGRDDVDE